MIDEREFDALLHDALGRRGLPPPFPVEVTDRVMARIADIGPAPRAELGFPQFMRWAIAATVIGAAVVWQGPSLDAAAGSFGHTVAGGISAMLKLATPLAALAGTMGRVCAAIAAATQTALRPLAPFQPFAHALLAATVAAMLGVTTFVVGRDVRNRVTPQEPA
jgi:hypothetical protein